MPCYQFRLDGPDLTAEDFDKMARGITPKGGRRVRYDEDGNEYHSPVVENEDGEAQ